MGRRVGVTPFPWTQLYVEEMEGKKLRNYYHWLAPTYWITLATNPAIALPCGLDHKEMPFGLQVIGRFRGDGEVLGAAHAMEQAFKHIPGLARPLPDIAQAAQTHARAEVDRHPSAQAQCPADARPRTGSVLSFSSPPLGQGHRIRPKTPSSRPALKADPQFALGHVLAASLATTRPISRRESPIEALGWSTAIPHAHVWRGIFVHPHVSFRYPTSASRAGLLARPRGGRQLHPGQARTPGVERRSGDLGLPMAPSFCWAGRKHRPT